jgi:2-polyprenyl-3-methyl-5-hydroxy-6-metoxy-1,4-benzoquinol methylase
MTFAKAVPKPTYCILCGCALQKTLLLSDLSSPYSEAKYSLVACEKCHQLNTYPMPFEVELSRIYSSRYAYSLHSLFAAEKRKRGRSLLKYASGPPASLCDLGCGDGSLLLEAKRLGYTVTGCEIDSSSVGRANALLGGNVVEVKSINEFLAASGTLAKNVVMSHSLEHLLTPGLVLRRIFEIMPLGGRLILALPDADVGLRSLAKRSWGYWQVPVHTVHFRQETFIKHLENLGFARITASRGPFDFLTLGSTMMNIFGLKSTSKLTTPSSAYKITLVTAGWIWRSLVRWGRSEMVVVAHKDSN